MQTRLFPSIFLFLGLALTAALGLWLFSPDDPGTAPHANRSIAVSARLPPGSETVQVQRTALPVWEESLGTVRPLREIQVGSQIQARVEDVLVRSGDHVHSGDLLVRLDDREIRARQAQARHEWEAMESSMAQAGQAVAASTAGLELSEAEYQRIIALHRAGAAAASELDRARAAFLQARAGLEQARQSAEELTVQRKRMAQALEETDVILGHARITAPEDGVIAVRHVEPGDIAQPGQVLLTLQTAQALRLEVLVPERHRQVVALGVSLPVRLDALNLEIEALVDEIIPAADPRTRSFLVKLALPRKLLRDHPEIHPGTFGLVRLPLGEEQTVLVPRQAVLRVGQLEMTAVVHDDAYTLRHLRLGRSYGDMIEVLSGLQGGENVWLHPTLP